MLAFLNLISFIYKRNKQTNKYMFHAITLYTQTETRQNLCCHVKQPNITSIMNKQQKIIHIIKQSMIILLFRISPLLLTLSVFFSLSPSLSLYVGTSLLSVIIYFGFENRFVFASI